MNEGTLPITASFGLRLVVSVAKITPILERIGDYVKDICGLNVYLRRAVFIRHSVKFS